MHFRCRFHQNSKSASTSSTLCKKDILVLATVCCDVSAVRKNNAHLHYVVHTEAQCVRCKAVPSAENPTAAATHGWGSSADQDCKTS